jgi:hypothetical protein
MFGQRNEEILDQFTHYFEKPEMLNKAIKKRVEDLKPLANLVKAIVEMPGWKTVIEPFLEGESSQQKSFQIFTSNGDEKQKYMMLGKAQAFFQFLMFIKNLVAIADVVTIADEEEEG